MLGWDPITALVDELRKVFPAPEPALRKALLKAKGDRVEAVRLLTEEAGTPDASAALRRAEFEYLTGRARDLNQQGSIWKLDDPTEPHRINQRLAMLRPEIDRESGFGVGQRVATDRGPGYVEAGDAAGLAVRLEDGSVVRRHRSEVQPDP